MAQNPHEYLIEQLQFTGDESVGSSSNKIKLNFNHPCKELIWVVQPDANVDYCASLICGTPLFDVLGAQPFNYTDAIDSLPNAIHAFGGPGATTSPSANNPNGTGFITSSGAFQDAGADDMFLGKPWGYKKVNMDNNKQLVTASALTIGIATVSLATDGYSTYLDTFLSNLTVSEQINFATTVFAGYGVSVTQGSAPGVYVDSDGNEYVINVSQSTMSVHDAFDLAQELNPSFGGSGNSLLVIMSKSYTTVQQELTPALINSIYPNYSGVDWGNLNINLNLGVTELCTGVFTVQTSSSTDQMSWEYTAWSRSNSGRNYVVNWNPYHSGSDSYDDDNSGGMNGHMATGSAVSDAGTFVLNETSLEMHCWGENPVVTAKLQLNGQDRFSEREGTYFDLVQPYQHHTRNPDTGINVYSFALRPEEHQPSGTCNFSRIDNATLQLVLSNATVGGTNTAKVRVYATNYNVLRIMSGMGGLAYSN
jgi:hypothetical protein